MLKKSYAFRLDFHIIEKRSSTWHSPTQEQGSEHDASHRPTEVMLEDYPLKLEGFNGRFDQIEHKLESEAGKMENAIEEQR